MTTPYDKRFVELLDDKNLKCRNYTHNWEEVYFGKAGMRGIESKYGPSIIVRQAECTTCGALGEVFYNAHNANRAAMGFSFQPVDRRIRYPEGYLFKRGESGKEPPPRDVYAYEQYLRYQRHLKEKKNGRH